jgi:DNA polymerase V
MSAKLFSPRRIAIYDANGFYAQDETIHRPEVARFPIAILGNTGGIVIAANAAAKALGVDIGVTAWDIKKVAKGNHVYVFSANFENYAYFSRLLFTELRKHTPFIKIYSIDEGLLDINHIGTDPMDKLNYGFNLVAQVDLHTRIKGCVGIAPNISLVKIAVKLAKKHPMYKGVFEINEINLDWALEQTPIEKLWGIGSQSAPKLRRLGIKNAKQFRDFPHPDKIQDLLTINGRKIQLELHGVQCFRIEEPIEKKREISHMRTLGKRSGNIEELKEILATYATLAAEDMRKDGSISNEVRLFLMGDPHHEAEPFKEKLKFTFPTHTMDTVKIIRAVWEMFESVYAPEKEYKKVGITLSNLKDYESLQYTLFNENDSFEKVSLVKAEDAINSTWKEGTIRSGACGIDNGNFEAERPMMTPSYCTKWKDILVIDSVIGY